MLNPHHHSHHNKASFLNHYNLVEVRSLILGSENQIWNFTAVVYHPWPSALWPFPLEMVSHRHQGSRVCPQLLPVPRRRDPPVFNGPDSQDVDGLLNCSAVFAITRGGTSKLYNVVFYLCGVTKTWFFEEEFWEGEGCTKESFETGHSFLAGCRFHGLFGRPAFRKLDAEEKLSSRMQQPEESYMSYVEDMLLLCKCCNTNMTSA